MTAPIGVSGASQVPSTARCSDDITRYFQTDEEMRRAAERLRGDPVVGGIRTETRQQAYERFKITFASQTQLVTLARPESFPRR